MKVMISINQAREAISNLDYKGKSMTLTINKKHIYVPCRNDITVTHAEGATVVNVSNSTR